MNVIKTRTYLNFVDHFWPSRQIRGSLFCFDFAQLDWEIPDTSKEKQSEIDHKRHFFINPPKTGNFKIDLYMNGC